MAAASGAFGVKAGYNQSAGGYYTVVAAIAPANFLAFTPGTGSGGAATVGTFATLTWASEVGGGKTSSLLAVGNVLKDMGKTVVSSGRTFRKFQGVAASFVGAGGVTGVVGTAAGVNPTGYLTGYLEVAREGTGGVSSAPVFNSLARAF